MGTIGDCKIADDRAKKAMIDAARLADELRAEQEVAQLAERSRKNLDYQVKDMKTNLMMNNADLLRLRNLSAGQIDASRSSLSHKKKIIKIMKECNNLLINFKAK